MLRPIGSKPSAVYWRRRLLVIAALLLAALTFYVVVLSGGDKKQPAGGPSRSGPATSARPSGSGHSSSSGPALVSCVPSVLRVAAGTAAKQYRVGDQPLLEIQVTNTGSVPCIANLSDEQIELVVFNGASRVWGSHDCKVVPGNSPVELMPARPVRRSIQWTGLSSQPGCAGNRQRVGAGAYTLGARLGQVNGAPATFSIAP